MRNKFLRLRTACSMDAAFKGVWCVCLIFSMVCSVLASEPSSLLKRLSLEQLMEYSVQAPAKLATPLSDAPGSVSLITYDQIQKSSARTIPELLRLVPGVHTRWNPMVQSIEIRSFGSSPFTSKVLLLIDGIPFNSWNKGGFPQHPGFDFFNINNVKHIEVIRGPGSALYGENALNGVINIVTLNGSEFNATEISALVGPRETESIQATHGRSFNDDTSLFVSTRVEQTQLPTEFWREQESYTESVDVFAKLIFDQFQFSAYVRQDEFDGYREPLEFLGPEQAFESDDKIEQDILILAGKHQLKGDNGKWSIESNLSYSEREGSHCGSCHALSESAEFKGKSDHGYQAFANTQLNLSYFDKHQLLLGAEIRRLSSGDSIEVITSEDDPLHAVKAYDKYSLFVQDKISFVDPNIELYAGLRYDSSTDPSLFDSELVPRMALVAKPTEDTRVKASWSKATRYPSFVELYQNTAFIGAPNIPIFRFQPNKDLEPETIDSFELGVEYAISDYANIKHTFFYNDINKPIVSAASLGAGAIRFENHPDDANVKGIENEFLFSLDSRWDVFMNWSYQLNKQKGSKTDSVGHAIEFTYAPKHKVNMGFNYRHEELLNLNMDLSWRDKYEAPRLWSELETGDPTPFEMDDYAYLNFKLSWTPALSVKSGKRPLKVSLIGTNVGKDTPEESLIGADGEMVGREFWLEVEYKWE